MGAGARHLRARHGREAIDDGRLQGRLSVVVGPVELLGGHTLFFIRRRSPDYCVRGASERTNNMSTYNAVASLETDIVYGFVTMQLAETTRIYSHFWSSIDTLIEAEGHFI